MEQAKNKQAAGYERCVICGSMTAVRRDTPVAERVNYIEGCGQLCAPCCRRLTANARGTAQTDANKAGISSGSAAPLK